MPHTVINMYSEWLLFLFSGMIIQFRHKRIDYFLFPWADLSFLVLSGLCMVICEH